MLTDQTFRKKPYVVLPDTAFLTEKGKFEGDRSINLGAVLALRSAERVLEAFDIIVVEECLPAVQFDEFRDRMRKLGVPVWAFALRRQLANHYLDRAYWNCTQTPSGRNRRSMTDLEKVIAVLTFAAQSNTPVEINLALQEVAPTHG